LQPQRDHRDHTAKPNTRGNAVTRLATERSCLKATSTLVNLRSALTDGYNLHTTNNPGKGNGRGNASGGTCFGDSGGPVFHPANSNQVVGITSFGLNQNCKGADFAFRTDVNGVSSWILGPH